MKSLLQSFIR